MPVLTQSQYEALQKDKSERPVVDDKGEGKPAPVVPQVAPKSDKVGGRRYVLFFPENSADGPYRSFTGRVQVDGKEIVYRVENGQVKTSSEKVRDALVKKGFLELFEEESDGKISVTETTDSGLGEVQTRAC